MGSENYYIGKGKVSIAPWPNSAVAPTYTELGNAPKFEYEMTEETKEHFSSQQGTKEQDAEITITTGYALAMTLDEISASNLKMFCRGQQVGDKIYANMDTNRNYAIKFVSDNPTGLNQTIEFHKVKLTPQGAFSLISDDFTTLNFNGKGLSDRANFSTSPFFTTTLSTTTTTTTTTA
ncbi:MAG: hypothetical protein CSYNP_01587 [Syntrophus sp. SKADARSKE-3]|nr:hypothetical protein [Syntrophus sp. SKADARSKE-3]